eukprot:jgi/Bigna1/133036/aug1.19_g7744
MLKSHPQIENYGEMVTYQHLHSVADNKKKSTQIERFFNELSPKLKGPFDYGNNWEEMLNVCLAESLNPQVKSVGLKWIFSDGLSRHVDEVVEYCNKNDVRVIFLRVMREKYNIKKNETLPEEQAVDIPVEFLQNKIKWIGWAQEQIRKFSNRVKSSLQIDYEDMMDDPKKYMQDIQSFLQVDAVKMKDIKLDGFQKMHTGSIDTLVSGWREKRMVLMKESTFKNSITEWETCN